VRAAAVEHATEAAAAATPPSADAPAKPAPPLPPPAGGEAGSAALANLPEEAEAAVLYVRFRAGAGELPALLHEMEARLPRREYAQLLGDLHAQYCSARLQLLLPLTQVRMARAAADAAAPAPEEALQALMRRGCGHLLTLCATEYSLFEGFFARGAAEMPAEALAPLLDPLATILYDLFRPRLLQAGDVDGLCALVELLQGEMLDEHVRRRGDAVAAVVPFVRRTLGDVQERLLFRAHTFLRQEVHLFSPTAADLDFPKCLEPKKAEAGEGDSAGSGGGGGGGAGEQNHALVGGSGAWYPPVRATLAVLGKLYRTVEPETFAGVAQEAVAVCTEAVQRASQRVGQASGSLHGQLFLIRHLLLLREQIAPFETEFAIMHKELDFTHMRSHLRRIVSGETSIFALTAENALLAFAGRGAPRVVEQELDSKKELEKLLKATCEAYIMAITKMAVEPMLSFIAKVTAVRVAGAGTAARLREQAFATPQKLAEMVASVNDALANKLPGTAAHMRLYLPEPSTRSILFKPIKSNIAEGHSQVAELLEAEYSPEDVAQVGLNPPDKLAELLDALA